MTLRLTIVSRHQQGLGERASMEFGQTGGTIGRSLESDWVLPDSQRFLSSRHASIDYRSGSYYIIDTSTNGVYVNDSEQPVGRGNPQRLFSGDRIRIGEYEMSVEITDPADSGAEFQEGHVDPVARAQRVPPPDPTRADLLAPHEITAVGIEMLIREDAQTAHIQQLNKVNAASLSLAADPPESKHQADSTRHTTTVRMEPNSARFEPTATTVEPQPAAPAQAVAAARRAEPPPVSAAVRLARATPKTVAQPRSAAPATPSPAATVTPPAASSNSTLDAFFRGAGLPAQKLDGKQAERMLHTLGQVMREVALGISDNLHLRTEQKNALRVPTTAIQPQNDNPLKFAATVEESLNNLLLRHSAAYPTAVDAVRETFADIKQHQQHLLGALRKAVVDYVGRLDPEALESKIGSGKAGALRHAANKLKYWDLFKDLYQVVAQHQPGQFPPQFLEELTRAYESEVARSAAPTGGHQSKAVS